MNRPVRLVTAAHPAPSLRSPWWRRGAVLAGGGLVIAVLLSASHSDFYWQQLITAAMIYAISAVSIDLVWGYTGILSMGHAVFFGIGAYTVGLFSARVNDIGATVLRPTHWWTYPVALLAAVVFAAVVAVAVGMFAFSGKVVAPLYVAVVTLALTLVLGTLLEQTKSLGGQQGLSGFIVLDVSSTQWFWIAAATLAAVTALGWILVRSDCGLLLRAIRDNEMRVRYLGYNVPAVKVAVFALSGAMAALGGALFAGFQGFVSPPFIGFLAATQILIWVAVGGKGTLFGPILGAVAINLVGPKLSERFPFWWALILGVLFVIVVVFLPDGLLSGLAKVIQLVARPLGLDLGRLFGADGRELVSADDRSPRLPRASDAPPVLSIRGLRRGFGGLEVLRGVDLDVQHAELLCVLGPNGAGKTTLLGVLSDGSAKFRGDVVLNLDGSQNIRGLPPHRLARAGIVRKFQSASLFNTLTVVESLLLAGRRGRIPSIWRRSGVVAISADARDVALAAGLGSQLDVLAHDLSHGSRQALELAMSVASRPSVLLLDEPTAGLTAEERSVIGDILRTLVDQRDMTVILIEHDFDFVRRICDRVAVLHEGRILELGTMEEISGSAVVRTAYLGSSA